MADRKFTPKRNITDDAKLALTGEPWSEDNRYKRPTMKLRAVNGNVRITVYQNHPEDGDDSGRANANMDIVISNILVDMVEEAATNPNFETQGIINRNYSYAGGVKSEKMKDMSTVMVGRDADGVIVVMVECENARRCVFPITPNFTYRLVNANGKPLDPGVVSAKVALGWVKAFREVIGHAVNETFKEREAQLAKERGEGGGQGGQGGYGGKKSYGQGGYGGKKSYGDNNGGYSGKKSYGGGNSGGGDDFPRSGRRTTDVFDDVA